MFPQPADFTEIRGSSRLFLQFPNTSLGKTLKSMNFNEIVKKEMLPILASRGYFLAEELQGSVRFESKTVSLLFAQERNSVEGVNLYIGRKFDQGKVEFIDFAYFAQLIFRRSQAKVQVNLKSLRDVVEYYRSILEANPEILAGDKDFFNAVEEIYEMDVEQYNRKFRS